MKKITSILILFLLPAITFSQNIEWQKCYGGSGDDHAHSIQQTADGGYIVAGSAYSNDGDVSGNHGGLDYWVIKLNSSNEIEWQKCYGGSSDDWSYSIQQTIDGGYIVAGSTNSNDGDVSGYHGQDDYWIIKLDSSGNLEWQKCYGGSADDFAYFIQQITDGGYIIAGWTESNDGDVFGNHGFIDYWIIKLDSSGNLEWQKCYGGSNLDYAHSIQQTTDEGYIVAGYTFSNDGDVTGNHGSADCWIIKLDSSGNLEWQKCYGGSDWDDACSIQQTTDGGYIVAGCTYSNDGDVSGNHGGKDYWITKLNSTGNLAWQKCYGGNQSDDAYSIQQTPDGGYIMAGYTFSNDGDVSSNHGQCDYWIIKLNSLGNLEWQKCYGGSGFDVERSIQQTTDGGYIVAGYTYSIDGDVSGNHGGKDYWIVKLDSSFNNIYEITNNYKLSIHQDFTKELINIYIENPNMNTIIEIININGNIMYSKEINSSYEQIDVSKYSKGIYFVKVRAKDFMKIEKIIII